MSNLEEQAGYVDQNYLLKVMQKVEPIKRKTYEMMRLSAGHHAFDLGCGPASDTLPMAEIVGETGKVVGIDHDPQMIEIANQRVNEAGLSDNISHLHGDANELPFDDNIFDASRSERVFQHVKTPERLLSEMIRVTKPGSWVVVADTDHSSLSSNTPSQLLDIEWIVRRVHAERFTNGYSGRQLYGLFNAAGLQEIEVYFETIYVTDYKLGRYFQCLDNLEKILIEGGHLTREQTDQMDAAMRQLDEQGEYFGYATMVIVAGRKP